jgi:hypothetical protein
LRTSEHGLEFDTPNVEVKKAKKGKAKMKKDKATIIDTETYKKWISDPDSVKDILRQPRPLPRNREEVRVCAYAYIHTYIHTCVCIHTHAYTYVHTYIHIYIHMYIHTYIHTPRSGATKDQGLSSQMYR